MRTGPLTGEVRLQELPSAERLHHDRPPLCVRLCSELSQAESNPRQMQSRGRSFHIGSRAVGRAFARAANSSRKRMKIARHVERLGGGGSGEVDLDNGGSNAVILDDPERARLSE